MPPHLRPVDQIECDECGMWIHSICDKTLVGNNTFRSVLLLANLKSKLQSLYHAFAKYTAHEYTHGFTCTDKVEVDGSIKNMLVGDANDKDVEVRALLFL